jgi:hypothetical protein
MGIFSEIESALNILDRFAGKTPRQVKKSNITEKKKRTAPKRKNTKPVAIHIHLPVQPQPLLLPPLANRNAGRIRPPIQAPKRRDDLTHLMWWFYLLLVVITLAGAAALGTG